MTANGDVRGEAGRRAHEPVDPSIGDRIRDRRNIRGWSQRYAAW
jgi:hypothetical protein